MVLSVVVVLSILVQTVNMRLMAEPSGLVPTDTETVSVVPAAAVAVRLASVKVTLRNLSMRCWARARASARSPAPVLLLIAYEKTETTPRPTIIIKTSATHVSGSEKPRSPRASVSLFRLDKNGLLLTCIPSLQLISDNHDDASLPARRTEINGETTARVVLRFHSKSVAVLCNRQITWRHWRSGDADASRAARHCE